MSVVRLKLYLTPQPQHDHESRPIPIALNPIFSKHKNHYILITELKDKHVTYFKDKFYMHAVLDTSMYIIQHLTL